MNGTSKGLLVGAAMAMAVLVGCGDDDGGDADAGTGGIGGSGGAVAGTGGASGSAGFGTGGESGIGGASGAGGMAGSAGDPGTPTPSGGEIRDGRCYPPGPAPTREELGDAIEVLDTGGIFTGPASYPGGVIYGIDSDGLYHVAAGSSTPEQIVATPDHRASPWILGDYLYYRITGSSDEPMPVERLPLSDLSATPERVLDNMPDYSALSESYLYVHDRGGTGNITRQPIDGGEEETIAESTWGSVRVFGDGYVYFIRSPFDDQIWRIPEAGGAEEMVVDDTFDISSYEVTDHGVFVSSYYALSFTPFGEPGTHTVFRANSTGIGLGTDHYVVGVTDTRLYWVLDDFPDGIVGWTALDQSDCDYVIDAGSDYHNAELGPDGVYITTFGIEDEIYRIGL